jgi:hypothetical protein
MAIVKRIVESYRWRRLLASCDLDPAKLLTPVDEPGPKNFIIAGCPRTGTSLLAAQLHRPPELVTVMEPWDGLRLEPARLFETLRSEIASGVLTSGRLDLEALDRGKVSWRSEDEMSYPIAVDDDYSLGVKWPTFWQYLDLLPNTRFLITIRHPSSVIASFEQTKGRLAQGFDYDVPFNNRMNSYLASVTDDDEVRRVLLYEYVNSRIIPHLERPNVLVVPYERWHDDASSLMEEISAFLDVSITSQIEILPRPVEDHPNRMMEMIVEHAPSARGLGYDI